MRKACRCGIFLGVASRPDIAQAYARVIQEHAMTFPICIYDRTGTGLRLPTGWWIDLQSDLPALVNGAARIDLPRSSKDEHPRLDPEVLRDLFRRIGGSQWLG